MEHKNSLGSRLQIRKVEDVPAVEPRKSIFPTLFSKLFTVYLSILIGTLVFSYTIFANAFRSYYVDDTMDIMINQAQSIAKEYQYILNYGQLSPTGLEDILYKIKVLDSYLGATTWLIDKNNNMMTISDTNQITTDTKIPPQQAIDDVFSSHIVKIESGFEQYFTTPVLTIGYPIKNGNEVQLALFIHTPMPNILHTIQEVQEMMLKIIIIASSFTFFLIYAISRQMTKPLKEMNGVAKQVANGDFNKRIVTQGEDEIAELGVSLNYMAGELEKIDGNRKSFIANVSHDMRSPLTSISGFVTAILDGTIPPEKQEKYLKIVLSESKRMINMTNDILELNKLEEGNLPLKKTTFDIHEMIKDSLAQFEGTIMEKKVQVSLLVEKKEQLVLADPDKIIRVVQNLLDNAFKFVGKDGKIQIETSVKGAKVWVYIRNDGPPIPVVDQQNIWDRFYKADLSRGKDKKGMGIGLVIVKEIIKQHQEQIGVTSKEGEMVSFYFTLQKAT